MVVSMVETTTVATVQALVEEPTLAVTTPVQVLAVQP